MRVAGLRMRDGRWCDRDAGGERVEMAAGERRLRVYRDAVDADLEVEVDAEAATGVAGDAEHGAALDPLSRLE